jgi:hypothetical protein
MTPITDDRSFLTDGRPYLTTRQAAIYIGYDPGTGPLAKDSQIRCFYTWAVSRGIRQQPGRTVYLRSDLDAAVRGTSPDGPELERMRKMAREDVADRRRRALQALRGKKP